MIYKLLFAGSILQKQQISWVKRMRLEDNEYFDSLTEFLEWELPSLETSVNATDDGLNNCQTFDQCKDYYNR
jgi:hypothetical protein